MGQLSISCKETTVKANFKTELTVKHEKNTTATEEQI